MSRLLGSLRPSTSLSAAVVCVVIAATVGTAVPVSAGVPVESDLSRRWVRHGFAEAWALGAVDSDGDDVDELVYGGRGVAMVDDRTLATGQPRWSFKWDDVPGNSLTGGDNMWTTGIEMVDATGDGVADPLLTTSDSSAYLLDGITGAKVWRAPTDGGLSNGFALVDADADGVPDMFPTGSSTVLSGRTGEELWEAPIPKNARLAASGDFDGDGKRDVIVNINPPGAGTNPNSILPAVIATTVFALSSKGEVLYDFEPYNGIEAMAAADIDGDGADEAVLGAYNGILYVIDDSGIRWASFLGPAAITAIEVADTDGDGRDEIFAGTGRGALAAGVYQVVAYGPEGAERWRHVVTDPVTSMKLAQLDDDDPRELLVGGGTIDSAPFGSATALETGLVEPRREKWWTETGERVDDFALLESPGGSRVAIGSADALLRVVDARDGSPSGRWMAGGYSQTVAAGDLDRDGSDETITGNDAGQVIVSDAGGDELWAEKVSGGNNMSVVQVATGDVDGDGISEVGAAAEVYDGEQPGRLALYSSSGGELWSVALSGLGQDIVFTDLNGDGNDDVVAAEGGAGLGDPCAIGAYEGRTGERLWWMELPTCIVIHTDVADVDSDGDPEIGLGTQVLFGTPQVALLGSDGDVAWHLEPPQASAWVDLEPGRFVHGGFADQARGHLTERDVATGEILWQSFLPGDRNDGGSANRFGQLIPDTTGDGVQDVVTSSDARHVLLVDGRSGETLWATRTQAQDVPVTQAHQSGPVAYVAGPGSDPVIFAAQYSTGRQLSQTFVLSVAGEIIGSFPMEGDAHSASPAVFEPGVVGAVVGAGLGTYAYQIASGDDAQPVETELELTVEGSGAKRMLRVSLTSLDDGTGIGGRVVRLTADGSSIGSVVTDDSGAAQVVAPPRYRGGQHTFEAVFDGDAAYRGSSSTATT